MKKLIIIHTTQYGYHTNALMHCLYLSRFYIIRFICLDEGRSHIQPYSGVRITYVKHILTKKLTKALFIFVSLFYLLISSSLVMVYFFRGCSVLKALFPRRKMILDVRTLGVSHNESYNKKYNDILLSTALEYDYVLFLSRSIKEKLGYPKHNYSIVPLGANCLSSKTKDYSRLNLLYVGIFTNRHLEKTIEGVKLFRDRHPEIDISYTFIGSGAPDVVIKLKEIVQHNKLNDCIRFMGTIPHNQLEPFFSDATVGVSFVPITPYYDSQPVTKTYEYAMSGLFVIATATSENKAVVSDENGILIEDDAISFCKGIEHYLSKVKDLNEAKIRASLASYSWDKIVNTRLLPVIKSFS